MAVSRGHLQRTAADGALRVMTIDSLVVCMYVTGRIAVRIGFHWATVPVEGSTMTFFMRPGGAIGVDFMYRPGGSPRPRRHGVYGYL